MDNEVGNTQDIARLCDVLGVDPSAFEAFEKERIEPRKPALGHWNHRVVERPLPQTDGVRLKPRLPAAYSFLDSISPELLNQSGIGCYWEAPEPVRRTRTRFKPTQVALLSISSGSGKTTLASILSRILSGRGHSVLLADYSPFNTIRDLFRLRRDPSTAVSFVTGSGLTSPLPVVSRFNDGSVLEDFDSWLPLIAARTHFTFLDGITNVINAGRNLAKRGARIVVPVLPDLISAMSAMRFDRAVDSPRPSQVTYLLNRFDHGNAVHLDVKSWLRENLGSRLLPFEIPVSVSVTQVASGTLAATNLSVHSSAGRVMELLADWFEKTCSTEEAATAEAIR